MNSRTLFLHIAFGASLFVGSSCQQSSNQFGNQTDKTTTETVSETTDSTVISNNVSHPEQDIPAALMTETFEKAKSSKPSYAVSAVAFDSGTWLLDDALLGGSKDDTKNGEHSIRIRNNGKIAMQFDVQGATSVSISHGTYGTDGASSWQLWASKDGGKTFFQVDQTITTTEHELKSASFHLNAGQALRLEIRKISGGKNRINIDDVVISTGGSKVAGHTGVGAPVAETSHVRYTERRSTGTGAENSHLLLGNPSGAVSSTGSPDNYLIDQKYYTESYNRTKGGPNWVSWHIDAADLGSTDRLNNFRSDTSLPNGWYEVDNTSYKGSGFDKGHNCPSGDRTSSTEANSATFLMDNIIPQAPNNNQHTWEHLESYCRDQVKKGNEVYVVMGNYGTGGTGRNGYFKSIDQGRINVPAHIWKVVVIIPNGNNDLQRINAQTRVIAIDTPNDNSIDSNWMKYLCTVRDIEKATGYNLLSALPESVQDAVETQRFKGGN